MSSEPVRAETPDDPADGVLVMNPWVLWGALVLAICICTGLAFALRPDSWGLFRTLAAGVIGGAFCHLSLYVNRILVADWGRFAR